MRYIDLFNSDKKHWLFILGRAIFMNGDGKQSYDEIYLIGEYSGGCHDEKAE
jgi:hypothetical protein